MQLSIIIPLYNTERYIERCIRSIYTNNNLSHDNYEVLVINDGSTDNSRTIVERLQCEFTNIKLINKENGGQSTARNIGFDLAKGRYIFCLDSDDSLEMEKLVIALEYAIRNELDMLPIFFRTYDENHVLLVQNEDNYPIINNAETGGEFMTRYVISGSMWRYLYRTALILENNLRLTEGIYHEDEEFVVKFMSFSKKIAYQRHLVYNHIVRGDSTVNKKDKKHRVKLLKDLLVVIENLDTHRKLFLSSSREYQGLSKKIEQLLVSVFLRMKRERLTYREAGFFINEMKNMGLYPLKIQYLGFKFKGVSMLFNNTILNRLYYR